MNDITTRDGLEIVRQAFSDGLALGKAIGEQEAASTNVRHVSDKKALEETIRQRDFVIGELERMRERVDSAGPFRYAQFGTPGKGKVELLLRTDEHLSVGKGNKPRYAGRVVILYDGEAWQAGFGSMDCDVLEFLSDLHADYLAGKMMLGHPKDEIDFEMVSAQVEKEVGRGVDINVATAINFEPDLVRVYGEDWVNGVPRKPTDAYRRAREAADLVCAFAAASFSKEKKRGREG